MKSIALVAVITSISLAPPAEPPASRPQTEYDKLLALVKSVPNRPDTDPATIADVRGQALLTKSDIDALYAEVIRLNRRIDTLEDYIVASTGVNADDAGFRERVLREMRLSREAAAQAAAAHTRAIREQTEEMVRESVRRGWDQNSRRDR